MLRLNHSEKSHTTKLMLLMACLLTLWHGQPFVSSQVFSPNDLSPFHEVEPDAFLDPPDFIRERHFECEEHHIKTPDNYIITLHRVINPLVPRELRPQLRPVLLQHGFLTSSFNSIIASDRNLDRPHFDRRDLKRIKSPGTHGVNMKQFVHNSDPYITDSLAFLLANSAYDVWLGNTRGSTYSLNHTHLDYRYDVRYWDFSFHEMAIYDLPTMIDYILSLRNRRSLSYVGHSQGNQIMFVLQSLQPEWANKVKPFVAMAPVAFVPNVYFGLLRIALQPIDLTRFNQRLKGQVAPKTPQIELALDLLCRPKLSEPWCDLILGLMLGNNLLRQNKTRTAVLAHHIPEGTSFLNSLHLLQLIKRGTFESFDFGPKENLMRYGTTKNPRYPIERIRSPDIALISANTDTLATKSNYRITKAHLRVRLIDDFEIPDLVWGHSDYIYGKGSGKVVNVHIRSLMDKYRLID